MSIVRKSSNKTMDLYTATTEIESFDTNVSLSNSFEYSITPFLKSKTSALDDIIVEGEEELFDSNCINRAPKLGYKQEPMSCKIPYLSLD
jgi:hypothetical protein